MSRQLQHPTKRLFGATWEQRIAIRAVLAALFVAWSFLGFNAAFSLSFLGLGFAAWSFPSPLPVADEGTRIRLRKRFVELCITAVFFASAPVSCAVQTRILEMKLKPTIAAVYRYHQNVGHYPEELEDLVPDYLRTLPDCSDGRPYRLHYFTHTAEGRQVFHLVCPTFAYNKLAYDSRSGRWRNRD